MEIEMVATLISILAVIISFVSLYRSRKYNEMSLRLQEIDSQLSQKQLDRISEQESVEDQPLFLVQTKSIHGLGGYQSPDYVVKIEFEITHLRIDYPKAKSVSLVSLKEGVFKSSVVSGVYLEHIDIRQRDPVIGEFVIVVKPDSNLSECKLHISYVDCSGVERIQQYSIFPSGPRGPVPFSARFTLEKIYQMKDTLLWRL